MRRLGLLWAKDGVEETRADARRGAGGGGGKAQGRGERDGGEDRGEHRCQEDGQQGLGLHDVLLSFRRMCHVRSALRRLARGPAGDSRGLRLEQDP